MCTCISFTRSTAWRSPAVAYHLWLHLTASALPKSACEHAGHGMPHRISRRVHTQFGKGSLAPAHDLTPCTQHCMLHHVNEAELRTQVHMGLCANKLTMHPTLCVCPHHMAVAALQTQ
eukprot:scaffold204350_cov26-Tisochrysis_lutea.AAC.1